MHLIDLHLGAQAARRRIEAPLLRTIERARRSVRSLRATVTAERRRGAAQADAVEDTYHRARAAGAGMRELYWLAVARDAVRKVSP